MIKNLLKHWGLTTIILFFLFGCVSENASNKKQKENYLEKTNTKYKGRSYNTFYNGVEGYEILVPFNWLHKNHKNTALTIYTEKINDLDFLESLDIISIEPPFKQNESGDITVGKIDFDEFYSSHLSDITSNNNLGILAEGEDVINNNSAKWALFKSGNEGEKINLLKYFITAGNRIYILTGTCKETDFAIYGPQFNDIISSFKQIAG